MIKPTGMCSILLRRWIIKAGLFSPPECFFNKDGTWYYAGVYKAFRLEDLTTQEWAELPTEVRSVLLMPVIKTCASSS